MCQKNFLIISLGETVKLSDNTFNYLLNAGVGPSYRNIFTRIFKNVKFSLDNEYILTLPVYKELMAIAAEEDPDYESLYVAGEEANINISFYNMSMYTSLAGHPAYSNEFDYEEEEEDQAFDVIGDWDIDLRTKEVEFSVREDT